MLADWKVDYETLTMTPDSDCPDADLLGYYDDLSRSWTPS